MAGEISTTEQIVEVSTTENAVAVNVTEQAVAVTASDIGLQGANGQGVPTGGATGKLLAKKSGTDYDTEWITVDSSTFVKNNAENTITSPSSTSVPLAIKGAVGANVTKTIVAISGTSGGSFRQVTVNSAGTFYVGQTLTFSGFSGADAGNNGTWTISGFNSPTSTTFWIAGLATGGLSGSPVAIYAGEQSANLQEWKTSGGTVVASVDAGGTISGNGQGLRSLDPQNSIAWYDGALPNRYVQGPDASISTWSSTVTYKSGDLVVYGNVIYRATSSYGNINAQPDISSGYWVAISPKLVLDADKGSANGVATLDGSGLVPSSQIPPLAISDTFVVASESAMLALTAQVGDVAVRTDNNKTFILQSSPASTLTNWVQILTPPAVTSIATSSPITGGTITTTGTIGINDATTEQKGAVQLTDSVSSTSTTTAATPNSVKTVYDLATTNATAQQIHVYVKNGAGVALTKGQAVYINGASGANPTIVLAKADAEATSSKTLGLLEQDLAVNAFGYVATQGLITGVNTGSAVDGDPVWLSSSTAGGLLYGLANKPSAPNHLVFIGYVLRAQSQNGVIYIKAQNGFELEELHNVAISSPTTGQTIAYDSTTKLWSNVSSITPTAHASSHTAGGSDALSLSPSQISVPLATAWVLSTLYYVGDVVYQSGTYYVCRQQHTSSGTNNVGVQTLWASRTTSLAVYGGSVGTNAVAYTSGNGIGATGIGIGTSPSIPSSGLTVENGSITVSGTSGNVVVSGSGQIQANSTSISVPALVVKPNGSSTSTSVTNATTSQGNGYVSLALTIGSSSGFSVGNTVILSSTGNTTFNGTYKVIYVSGTAMTLDALSAGIAPTGTFSGPATVTIVTNANAQELQDKNGTALATIDGAGNLNAKAITGTQIKLNAYGTTSYTTQIVPSTGTSTVQTLPSNSGTLLNTAGGQSIGGSLSITSGGLSASGSSDLSQTGSGQVLVKSQSTVNTPLVVQPAGGINLSLNLVSTNTPFQTFSYTGSPSGWYVGQIVSLTGFTVNATNVPITAFGSNSVTITTGGSVTGTNGLMIANATTANLTEWRQGNTPNTARASVGYDGTISTSSDLNVSGTINVLKTTASTSSNIPLQFTLGTGQPTTGSAGSVGFWGGGGYGSLYYHNGNAWSQVVQASTTIGVAQGGTGATAVTGSGNNVLDTSPAISTPTITSPIITTSIQANSTTFNAFTTTTTGLTIGSVATTLSFAGAASATSHTYSSGTTGTTIQKAVRFADGAVSGTTATQTISIGTGAISTTTTGSNIINIGTGALSNNGSTVITLGGVSNTGTGTSRVVINNPTNAPNVQAGTPYTIPDTAPTPNVVLTSTALVTITLPTAVAGKEVRILCQGAGGVNSASSNVYPKTSRSLGATILGGAGSAILVCDGTNWQIMA